MTAEQIHKQLQKLGTAERAKASQRFFKTGPGEYGEGDLFIGISVPDLRTVAREHQEVTLEEVIKLLRSPYHEERLLAMLLLVRRFQKGKIDEQVKKQIYDLYLANTDFINNWDLVDSSAPHIVGEYLMTRSRKPLYSLAKSKDLWERRISIIATQAFIRRNEFVDTLEIARLLLADREDLIHKAVGWMLREIGNRDMEVEEDFLAEHYRKMPRTMLRYAIEKFPEERRQGYLKGMM